MLACQRLESGKLAQSMDAHPSIGELFALLSPLCWACAVILFRIAGRQVPPLALNLFKNTLVFPLFLLTFVALGAHTPGSVSWGDRALLVASGVLGIAIADVLFFMCLNRLGASRQAIVNTAYSPPIILLSVVFLGERLGVQQVLGIVLILLAVLVIGRESADPETDACAAGKAGVALGLGACFAQAVSIVMIKPFMGEWPLLWMTTWRMGGGLVAALGVWVFLPAEHRSLAPLFKRRAMPAVLGATLMGTYLSLLLWMGGFKYAPASVASALNQTSTLFTFVLAVWVLREPVTRRALQGLGLGLGGVLLMTL